jgi:hypothetical protein
MFLSRKLEVMPFRHETTVGGKKNCGGAHATPRNYAASSARRWIEGRLGVEIS